MGPIPFNAKISSQVVVSFCLLWLIIIWATEFLTPKFTNCSTELKFFHLIFFIVPTLYGTMIS